MAYETNSDDALRLKTSLQSFLDYQKKVNEASGGVVVEYQGSLDVTAQGEMYGITFPRILIKGEDTAQANNLILDLGIVSMNAIPAEKPNEWKMSVTLPSSYSFTDTDGEVFAMTMGMQNLVGLYSEKRGYFTKVSGAMSDFTFKVQGEDIGLKIGAITLVSNMDEDDNGLYSGPASFEIKDLSLNDPEENFDLSLASLKAAVVFERFELLPLGIYEERLLRHADTLKKINELGTDNTDTLDVKSIVAMLMDMYSFKAGASSQNISAMLSSS
jgi:hypothetical protein